MLRDGKIAFLYDWEGRDIGGGPRCWCGAEIMHAECAGLAGVVDNDRLFRDVTLSPRFAAAREPEAHVRPNIISPPITIRNNSVSNCSHGTIMRSCGCSCRKRPENSGSPETENRPISVKSGSAPAATRSSTRSCRRSAWRSHTHDSRHPASRRNRPLLGADRGCDQHGRAAAARPRLHPGRRRAADRRRGGRRAPVPEKRHDPPSAPAGRIRRRSRQLPDDQAYECRDGARSQRCGLGNHPERARLSVHDGNAVLRRRPDRQPPDRAGADPGGDRSFQLLEGKKTGNFGQLAPSDARRFFLPESRNAARICPLTSAPATCRAHAGRCWSSSACSPRSA